MSENGPSENGPKWLVVRWTVSALWGLCVLGLAAILGYHTMRLDHTVTIEMFQQHLQRSLEHRQANERAIDRHERVNERQDQQIRELQSR